MYTSNYLAPSTSSIYCQRSTDGGSSFNYITLPSYLNSFTGTCNNFFIGSGQFQANSFPTIAIDKSGNVYLAWMQDDNGTLNIYCTRSTDAGNNWSVSPFMIPHGSSESVFFPWLTVNSSGVVSLSYYKENSSNLVDVYVANSYDGGLTYNSVTRITPTSENPDNATQECDYMGAVSLSNGETLPLWTDLSSGSHAYTTPNYYSGGTVAQSITIPSGQRALFAPGAVTQFASGTSLNVNGVLNAVGTASQPITFTSTGSASAGSWGSIIFSGPGANGSILNYINMQYGTNIQANNTSNITIENSNFTNNDGAISYSNSTGSVINNKISYSADYHAIEIQNASNVTCNLNTITKNNHDNNDVAILFGGGGTGWVGGNDMDYFNWGIGTIYGSSPLFGNTPSSNSRNNRITHCSDGIVIYQDSYPNMYDANHCWGYNTIDSNTVDISLNYFQNVNNYYLDALQDYWNNGNPSNAVFQIGSGSAIYTNGYLTSDPWSGVPLPSMTQGSGKIKGQIVQSIVPTTSSAQGSEFQASNFSKGTSPVQSVAIDSLLTGIGYLENSNNRKAENFFVSYLSRHPDNQRAYVELYDCADSTTIPDIINYFRTLPSKASNDQRLLLSYLYLKDNEIDSAKAVNNSLIASNPNTSLAARAMLNNFYIALYNENNVSSASALLSQIQSQSNLINPMELLSAQNALKTNGISANILPSKQNHQADKNSDVPKTYALSQNYPNPFNPTTIINYQIPNNNYVTLKVYDILGNVVKTLVDGYKTQGSYSINFNASSAGLASGVYFYQLRAGSFTATKKLLLLK